jgi:hypothetical protein
VLNKVDLVYANESKNAFTRFNKDTYYNKVMTATLTELDAENRLLLISPFKDAAEALDYVVRTRPRAASEITPWLKTGKYSFIIVSDVNLALLKASKDVDAYRVFLNQQFPGKF